MIFRPDSGQFYLMSQILMPEIRRRSKPLLPIRIASGRFLDAIGELAHGYLANHLQMQFYLNLNSEVFLGILCLHLVARGSSYVDISCSTSG